jgi:hypothetical protein
VKELDFSPAQSGVKTGVQEIAKALKTLDSGFRRNDVKKDQIDFFTPSPFQRGKKLHDSSNSRNNLPSL